MMIATERALRTLWYGLLCVWIVITSFMMGDELEARIWPVVRSQTVTTVSVSDHQICWTWRFFKARSAAVRSFTWQMYADNDDALFVTAETEGRPLQASRTTPGGVWREVPLCAELPRAARGAKRITVTGQIVYKTKSPWLIRHNVETVTWVASSP